MLDDLQFSTLEFSHARLRGLARSPWRMSYCKGSALPGVIVPDAHVEFALQTGAPASTMIVGQKVARTSPRAMIYAQRHGALSLQSTGANEVVAFRATPAVATIILRHSLEGCWDRPVELSDLIGEAHTLLDQLATTPPEARLAVLESWLVGRLVDWGPDHDLQHHLQRELLWKACGDTVSALADDLGFTDRTLRRRLATYAGISPKQLSMSGRILRASGCLRDRPDIAIAEIALMTGFGDQAAFTNAFRNYLDMTPGELRAEPIVFLERPH